MEAITAVKQKINFESEETVKSYTKSQVYYLLLAQQVIEHIRLGNFPAALKWAQEEMIPFSAQRPECLEIQVEILGLLAYQEPFTSPIRHLLDKSRHAWLAELVNQILLKTADSALEALLKQVLGVDGIVEETGGFEDEVDIKKWSSIQQLLSGTSLKVKSVKNSQPIISKIKLLKND